MTFLDMLQKNTGPDARTENNAATWSTTSNAVLDFFAVAGGMRNNIRDARKLFRAALAEDAQLAIRALFYLRDVRGGQGERDLFRLLYRDLARPWSAHLLDHIPVYGRWDDLFEVGLSTREIADVIGLQLRIDEDAMAEGKSVSLMAKWLPSENTSSKLSRKRARELAGALGLTAREYRTRIVALRKHISLVEQKMSANDWDEIDYGKLPSQASRILSKAFRRHDGQRYQAYLDSVIRGEAKMNANTVFTYEVMNAVERGNIQAAEAMWASLPDYTNGSNALVVADVSGSMFSYGQPKPIEVSVSLALYFAERNTGPFKDYFLTFSERPQLVKVRGASLVDKLNFIQTADWGMSTDIQKVFELLLTVARRTGVRGDDMPKVIYIISDMEFNQCTRGADLTNFQYAQRIFEQAGYTLPHLVFWNICGRNTNVPALKLDNRVTLISGFSQSTFRYAVEGKTPLESMLSILNSERYAPIVI